LRALGRNIAMTLGRQLVVVALGIVLAVFLARTLGPEGNGRYAVAILLPTTLASLLNLGVGPANVYFVGRGEVSVRTALWTSLRLWVALTLVGCLSGIVIVATRGDVWFPGLSTPLLWLALAAFPLLLLVAFLSNLLQAIQDFVHFNQMMVSPPLITLVLAGVTVGVLRLGVFGALLAMTLGSAGGLLVAFRGLRPHLVTGPDVGGRGYARRCVGYGWKAHLSNILSFLNYRSDVFLVNLFLAPAAVGVYVVAVQIAERLWILSQAVSTVLLPQLASLSNAEDQRRRLTPLIARWVFFISIVGALILALICNPLIALLFGERYAGAGIALIWLLPGIVLGSLARVLANDLAARGRPELNMYAAVGVVAVNISANLFLIPRLGIVGASIATTIAYSFNAILKLGLYARLSGNRWSGVVLIPTADWLQLKRSAAGLLQASK
jgi:O-antigen/teichoic acid export membrane protein